MLSDIFKNCIFINAELPKILILSLKINSMNLSHSLKMLDPIIVTFSGIFKVPISCEQQ